MSKMIGCEVIHKIKADFKKNRKYIKGNLIRYSEEKYESEFLELMKNGYLEMADINLEIAETFQLSQAALHYRFDEINEYEKWLCGV